MKRKEILDYRENIKEMFMKCLDEKTIDWKGYCIIEDPVNYFTGEPYRGRIRHKLRKEMDEHKWVDNRFITYTLESYKRFGEKDVSFEDSGISVLLDKVYYDLKENKGLSLKEYNELTKGMSFTDIEERFSMATINKKMYHISQVEGLTEEEITHYDTNAGIKPDKLIERIAKAMGVEVFYDRWCSAYYLRSEDEIHLPDPSFFKTEHDCNITALHELGHATGAEDRLNRILWGGFGNYSHAKEELIAEIISAFMGIYLNDKLTEEDLDQYKSYVQIWICDFEFKKNVMLEAIYQAEKAVAYIERLTGLNKEWE